MIVKFSIVKIIKLNLFYIIQFDIDCGESIFKFERTSGVIKANTQQTIILRFVPQHPINYYRRITCMIHNQGPLFLDLLGTCHSELVKPAVLLAKHLENYLTHVERGFSVYPPEQLNDLRREGRLELDDAGALMAPVVRAAQTHYNVPHYSAVFNITWCVIFLL